MKLKSFALITLLALQSAGLGSLATAQTCKDDFKRDPYLAGSNYVAYPGPKGSLTPAPKGYEPQPLRQAWQPLPHRCGLH